MYKNVNLFEHFDKLRNATSTIEVWIKDAYRYDSSKNVPCTPCLGVRDINNTGVIIDDVPWLISGTVLYSGTEVTSLQELREYGGYIELRAQSTYLGNMVTVDLGKRIFKKINDEGSDIIYVTLQPD